ncbi:Serine/threonine-protein kinase-like protein At3g51990 [Linum grandiflorum]
MALQIAKAVDTLHSHNPPIIHRDIKSANVLIDRNSNARLGDFGLAIRCGVDDDCRLRSTPPAGTMGYLDPCYVTPDNLSTKTDVFSFGILLLEIISGRKAIDVERRPSMKEVVDWLSTLSKLVPLHSWNGFNNPCMMVETMGRPVEFGSRRAEVEEEEEEGGKLGRRTVKDSRRVFSDLGTRSSLIDLMAGGADRSDSMRPPSSRFSRSIFGSARYVAGGARRTTQSKTVMSSSISNDNIADSCLRRNNSVGDGSELVSETKEKPPRSRFGAERSEDI